MGKLELVRQMYEHNEWANGRILECTAKVSADDLSAKPPGQYISIIADLAHDNQALLRNVLSQAALSQTEPCPDVGAVAVEVEA